MTDSPTQPRDAAADPTTLIWLDLETTGLDPHEGEVLEIAAFATNLVGNKTNNPAFHFVFKHSRDVLLPMMDDYVLQMHLGSGLLAKVWAAEDSYDPDGAKDRIKRHNRQGWEQFVAGLARLGGKAKTHYLAGNSIHFDRGWLEVHQPEALEQVSHRMLDVSSFMLVDPEIRVKIEGVAHRAMADAEMSHKTYVEKILPRMRPDFYQV